MFPLTRPYRQAIVTLVMLVTTVVPTGYVAVTAWRINRPGHRHEVAAEIGRQLGLQVALDGVRYPRPGEVVYSGVVLRQEEPRRKGLTEIARARQVRLRRGDRELTLEADGLQLFGESPKLAMAQVGALLQRSGDVSLERVTLAAPTCDIDLGKDILRYTPREVAGIFQADRGAPTVRVSYRIASRDASTRCELTLTRDRKAEPVRTSVTFKTIDGLPLPARVLDPYFDSTDWLGPAAKVEGTLSLRQTGARDWEADFQGDLLDVDLAALVERRFPSHRLNSLARVTIKSARWAERPGQGFCWVEARGELNTGPGTIGLGLLRALASEMQFRLSPKLAKLPPTRSDLDFRALGVAFEMTRDGEIRLDGGLGNEFAPDVVLVNQTSPLAYAPQGAANVRGLIKMLFPVDEAQPGLMVPLTPASSLLSSVLPVPPEPAQKEIKGN